MLFRCLVIFLLLLNSCTKEEVTYKPTDLLDPYKSYKEGLKAFEENAFFLAKKIVDKKLSVRQTESFIRALKSHKNPKSKSIDPNISNLESNVEDRTGLKVKIFNKKNNSGNVVFEYKDIDQLNHLLMVIKANY